MHSALDSSHVQYSSLSDVVAVAGLRVFSAAYATITLSSSKFTCNFIIIGSPSEFICCWNGADTGARRVRINSFIISTALAAFVICASENCVRVSRMFSDLSVRISKYWPFRVQRVRRGQTSYLGIFPGKGQSRSSPTMAVHNLRIRRRIRLFCKHGWLHSALPMNKSRIA